MSSTEPPKSGGTLKNYFKGMLGLPTAAPQPPPPSPSSSGAPPLQTTTPPAMAPLKIGRHDSAPELVGTPSDIGIWEVSHEMRGGGPFTWKRLFQDPATFTPKADSARPAQK